MDYNTFWVIFTILFWVLCALGITCAMICTFVYYEEFRWRKAERDYDTLVGRVNDIVNDILSQVNEIVSNEIVSSGGNEQE